MCKNSTSAQKNKFAECVILLNYSFRLKFQFFRGIGILFLIEILYENIETSAKILNYIQT